MSGDIVAATLDILDHIPRGVSTDCPASVSELEFVAGGPPPVVAEHGDSISVAVSQADGFAAAISQEDGVEMAWPEFPEPEDDEIPEPILLTDTDFQKAYDDARLLWRKDMVRLLKGGLIFYNGIYPLAEVLLNVYDYLSRQTAVYVLKEAK